MCRNDKNIFKATAIFVVALIVFGAMTCHHIIIHNKIIKHNVQKQVDKHKENSCNYYIVCDIDSDVHILFWRN